MFLAGRPLEPHWLTGAPAGAAAGAAAAAPAPAAVAAAAERDGLHASFVCLSPFAPTRVWPHSTGVGCRRLLAGYTCGRRAPFRRIGQGAVVPHLIPTRWTSPSRSETRPKFDNMGYEADSTIAKR